MVYALFQALSCVHPSRQFSDSVAIVQASFGSAGKESACSAGDLGLISGLGRSPEGSMATHSSILAWRIPWTEEPGGLQPMESKRVGHD